MGEIEKASRKRRRRAEISRFILSSVAAAGTLSIALVAPNVMKSMAQLGLLPNSRQEESIRRARKRLIQQGLLEYRSGKLRLTSRGERAIDRFKVSHYSIQKPKRWDGKWRVLIFDIPEKRKGLRDRVRRTLLSVGFIRLQDSVWLYPYDCEDLVILLKVEFKIGKDLLYMIVDSLEHDVSYKKHFKVV